MSAPTQPRTVVAACDPKGGSWEPALMATAAVRVGDRWAAACRRCPFEGKPKWRTDETALNRSIQHVLVVHGDTRPGPLGASWPPQPAIVLRTAVGDAVSARKSTRRQAGATA